MEIKTTNIRVQASKNYQVFEITFEADCKSSQDIESLKSAAIKYALKGINELCGEKEPQVELKTEVTEQPIAQIAQQNPVLGEVRTFEGYQYKYCYSKQNQQSYWMLVNLDDMQKGASKYYKVK